MNVTGFASAVCYFIFQFYWYESINFLWNYFIPSNVPLINKTSNSFIQEKGRQNAQSAAVALGISIAGNIYVRKWHIDSNRACLEHLWT